MVNFFTQRRNSSMEFDEVYFWTDTIQDWKNLLNEDKYKELIIEVWKDLVDKDLIKIYAYVIMPNHLHVVWELLELNGKEKPHASFNKATSHEMVKDLKLRRPQVLKYFKSGKNERERSIRIWQRDPLAVLMDSQEKVEQKVDYIHNNLLQEKWNLVKWPEDYPWSSAGYYANGDDPFDFLTHCKERFRWFLWRGLCATDLGVGAGGIGHFVPEPMDALGRGKGKADNRKNNV